MTIADLSVSRIKTADKCGLAYEYQYVRRLPAPYDKASKVFGTVIHDALEVWYGPAGSDQHKELRLPDLVQAEWWKVLPSDVAAALRNVLRCAQECDAVASVIAIQRPQIKGIRQTKGYLSSEAFARFCDARDRLVAISNESEEMRWGKDENAFQAYQKSLTIAQQLQDRWQRLPRPLVVEQPFDVEFAGMRVRGRIDQIRTDPDPEGQVQVEGLDVKTGKQLLTQMDAFIQAFLYDHACRVLPQLPVPDFWTFFMARHNKPQHGHIDYERHAKLAERIMLGVKDRIERKDFAPHYGMWCQSCDFAELCEKEISLWGPGGRGLTLEAVK